MLRRIKVYGRLRKFLKWDNGTFEADVNSAAEAIRFLLANWPELKKHIASQHYKILVGTYNLGDGELHDPAGSTDEISIVPVMVGAGGFFSSPVGKIVTGAALIGLTVATGGFAGAAIGTGIFTGAATSIAVGTIVAGIGVSLILGGVAQMLTPTPEMPTGDGNFGDGEDALDPQSNYSFAGIQNVSRSGVPVSLVYGWEVMVGSVVVSNGIDTVQVEGTA